MKPQIPWLRVFVEGVVIVGSILLAFGLQAWWEGTQEREEEQEILLGLHAEFVAHRSTLQVNIARQDTLLGAVGALVRAASGGDTRIPAGEVDEWLWRMLQAPTFDPEQGVYDALFGSGRLNVVRDRELRVRLAAWGGVVEEVRDNQLISRDFVFSTVVPYLSRTGIPLARAYEGSGFMDDWPIPLTAAHEVDPALRTMFSDPEFRSLAETRYFWIAATTGEFQTALDFVQQVLASIDRQVR